MSSSSNPPEQVELPYMPQTYKVQQTYVHVTAQVALPALFVFIKLQWITYSTASA